MNDFELCGNTLKTWHKSIKIKAERNKVKRPLNHYRDEIDDVDRNGDEMGDETS